MHSFHTATRWTGIWVLVMALLACSESRHVVTRQTDEQIGFKRIGVLPFHVVRPSVGETIAQCPLSGDTFMAGRVEPGASEVLTQLLQDRLAGKPQFYSAPESVTEGIWKDFLACQKPTIDVSFTAKLGKELDADGLLLGFVYAFRERVGTVYSAETPALVSFDLYLVESATGRVVWKATFSRSQKSLSENVLDLGEYVQGGMRWLTVSELASLGLNEVLKKLPVY